MKNDFKLVSVLLPTRCRPNGLKLAVESLVRTAAHPDRMEILLATDDDDLEAKHFVENICILTNPGVNIEVREWRGPRRGYARVYQHYNEMAVAAAGKHVLLWNDDTEMLTPEWDAALTRYDGGLPYVQFLRRDIYAIADTTFPFIDKRIVDALGGISRHMYTDTWIGEVAELAYVRMFRNDVVFTHHWPQQDAVFKEGLEAVRQSGQHEVFKMMKAEKEDDANKIRALVSKLKQ